MIYKHTVFLFYCPHFLVFWLYYSTLCLILFIPCSIACVILYALKVKPNTSSYDDPLLQYFMKDNVYTHIKRTITTHLGTGGAQPEFDMWEWLKFFINSKHCFLPLSAPVPDTGAKAFPVHWTIEWINKEEGWVTLFEYQQPFFPPRKQQNSIKTVSFLKTKCWRRKTIPSHCHCFCK